MGIPNPRKEELRQLLAQAEAAESRLSGILRSAESAMQAGAWISSVSGPFESGLSQARSDITAAAEAAVAEIRAEWAAEPAQVEMAPI